MDIASDWLPTPTNVNALPDPLREYIHALETHYDPALTLQQLRLREDQVAWLEAALAEGWTPTHTP